MSADFDHAQNRTYLVLRDRILTGAYEPGTQLKAVELAAALRISPTPVREALFRLVGEGLVTDLPHHGFFVPHLSAELLSELYRMSMIYLRAAITLTRTIGPHSLFPHDATREDPEDIFARLADRILARPGNALLLQRGRWPIMRLAPARKVERLLLGEIVDAETSQMAEALASGRGSSLVRAIERYHRRRLKIVTSVAVALRPKISRI